VQPLWIDKYDHGVPAKLKYPEIPVHEILLASARKYPNHTALCFQEFSITYAELAKVVNCFAEHLLTMGINAGDRVSICLPNSPQFVIAYYGVLLAGGVVAAINPAYPQREIEFQIEICRPRFLIGFKTQTEVLSNVQKNFNIEKLIIFSTEIGSVINLTAFDYEKKQEFISDLLVELDPGIILPSVTKNDTAVLQFSGGTTGIPKAAVCLHRNIVANITQLTRWFTNLQEGKEIFLTAIPLYHVYGMVVGLNMGIALGATIILIPDPKDLVSMLNWIQKLHVTFFPGIPSLYHAITQLSSVQNGEFDLSSIKACISGSAPLMEKTKKDFERLTGGTLVEGYGLSEAPTATHCNPIAGENRTGSIGLPFPDVDCKLISLDSGEVIENIGESGELLIRGPQVMAGYFQQEIETQKALENGWLYTGDIARMDKDGYFYIIGRKKELIKVGGLQVWPNEVESVVNKFPGIKESAVAGVPDDALGEVVKAWIVVDGARTLDVSKLKSFCYEYLASYKVPRFFEVIETLPRSAVGKVLRRELVSKQIPK
jgi:long-chain acyl-CoA synthetase